MKTHRSLSFSSQMAKAILLLFVLSVPLMLGAQNGNSQPNAAASSSQTHAARQTLHNHVRPVVSNGQAPLLRPMPPKQEINFSIVLPLRNQTDLEGLLGRLYDPASPDYHAFLSVQQFADRFGPSQEDYDAVVAYAQAQGFVVTGHHANRMVVPVRGTVEQVQSAFHVTMNVYRDTAKGREFFSPDREPSIDLAVPVAHITGLNNYSLPEPMLRKRSATQAAQVTVNGSGPGGSYLGSDMRAAYYGGSALAGAGQTVGLLQPDGYYLSNVDLTFNSAGQTRSVPINNVLVGGATGDVTWSGDDSEQVLDIVQAISMAPQLSQVLVYIGINSIDVLSQMASDNVAKQISCSWSWIPEDSSTADPILMEFAAQGQSFFAASGDSGAYEDFAGSFYYPQEDAYVTAVGGTHLTTNGPGGSWASETAWTYSGGGASPDSIPLPKWQGGVINAINGGSTKYRNVPDVAMEADWDNYMCGMGACYETGAGTSFAAPRWAGFMALINEQLANSGKPPMGFLNPAIYAIGQQPNYGNLFHDITIGSNDVFYGTFGGYNALPGYDLVTGWGSPNGQNLINVVPAPNFALSPSANNVTIPAGSSASLNIALSAANGFNGQTALSIAGLPSGVTASFSPSVIGPGQTSTLTLRASNSVTKGNAQLIVTGRSGSLSATTTIALSINFSLSVSPSAQTVILGQSINYAVSVDMRSVSNVTLTAKGLPTGAYAVFYPPTLSASGTSTMMVAAAGGTAPGTYSLAITATSGSLAQTVGATLVVDNRTSNFAVAASPATVVLTQQPWGASNSTTVTVSSRSNFSAPVTLSASGLPIGVGATFSPNPVVPSANGSVTSTMTLNQPLWPAIYGTFMVTVTGTSAYQAATQNVSLVINPMLLWTQDYGPAVTLNPGGRVAFNVAAITNNTASPITFSVTGLPNNVRASFQPNGIPGIQAPVAGWAMTLMTIDALPNAIPGSYPLNVTATAESYSNTASTMLTITPAGYIVSTAPSWLTLRAGDSADSTITVTSRNGFSGEVTLSVPSLPDGLNAVFTPNPVIVPENGSATTSLQISSESAATLGTAPLAITGAYYDLNGSLYQGTAVLPVTVNSSGEPSYVTLTSAFNRTGIFRDDWYSIRYSAGLDGDGYGYSLEQFAQFGAPNLTWNNIPFLVHMDWMSSINLGIEDLGRDVVSGTGQTILLPPGKFGSLYVLGTGVNGAQIAQPFTVTYTDGTRATIVQSMSDWQTPQNFPSEAQAYVMPYKNDIYIAGRVPEATYVYIYMLPVDHTRTVQSVTLPSNSNVEVLAMTMVP